MANQFNVTDAESNENTFEKADAFMNVFVKMTHKKTGEVTTKSLGEKNGIALRLKRAFDKALIEYAQQNPDHEFTLVGKLHVLDEAQATSYEDVSF